MNSFLKYLKSPEFALALLTFAIMLILIYNLLLLWQRLKNKKFHSEDKKSITLLGENHGLFKNFNFSLLFGIWGVLLINLIAAGSISYSVANIATQKPKVIHPRSPSLEAVEITAENPFKVVFNRPIQKEALKKSISPELPGRWKFASTNYPLFYDTLIFIPKISPSAESRYTISLKNVKNLAGNISYDYMLSFMTPSLPNIKSVSPSNGTEGVLPNQEIVLETDIPHKDMAKFEIKFSPEIETDIRKESKTKYVVRAKNGFKKSTTYAYEIYRVPIIKDYEKGNTQDAAEKKLVSQGSFRTLEAPGIADYGPKGNSVLTNETIWIVFKQDMDKAATEKAFAVSPLVSGIKSWEKNRKIVLKPSSPLAKNTNYVISVSKEAKAGDGSPLEDNFSFSFTTIGHVKVSSFYPASNATNVATSTKISITFNQAVDHASAESKFSISPSTSGSFSWSDNTLSFNHGGLSYATRYTVSIASGVKTVYGLDSIQNFFSSFTTKQQSIMLNVPSYRQSHMYSCMAAAARSALAYKGTYVSENQLLALIGYDSTSFSGTWGDSNAIWGDPYSGIVGNVDGKSGGVNWGYGAYWGPTAKAIASYRSAEVKTGWNVSGIAQEIANGNPVLVWWVNGVWPAYEVYWKTPSGKSIRGVNSMHVQVVKGFTGTVENPTSFTVTDSGYGYPSRTFDIGTFKAKWSWFGNSAVVVR